MRSRRRDGKRQWFVGIPGRKIVMFLKKRNELTTQLCFSRAFDTNPDFGALLKSQADQGHDRTRIACAGFGHDFNIAGVVHDFFGDDG